PGQTCGPLGSGALCDNTATCETSCKDGAGCSTGQICSTDKGTGVCLGDCTTGQACPSGLSCSGLWYGDKKGCQLSTRGLDKACQPCASGLHCNRLTDALKACLPAGAGIDEQCPDDGASCGPLGSGLLCGLGLCEQGCPNGQACAAGRVCSTQSDPKGVCLAD